MKDRKVNTQEEVLNVDTTAVEKVAEAVPVPKHTRRTGRTAKVENAPARRTKTVKKVLVEEIGQEAINVDGNNTETSSTNTEQPNKPESTVPATKATRRTAPRRSTPAALSIPVFTASCAARTIWAK